MSPFAFFDSFHAFNLYVDLDCFGRFGGVDSFDVFNGFNDGFVEVNGSDAIVGIDAVSSVIFLTVFLAVAFLPETSLWLELLLNLFSPVTKASSLLLLDLGTAQLEELRLFPTPELFCLAI